MAVGDRMNRSNARLSPIIAAGSRKETIPRWLNIVSFVTSQKPSRESAHPHGDDSHDQTRFRTHIDQLSMPSRKGTVRTPAIVWSWKQYNSQ